MVLKTVSIYSCKNLERFWLCFFFFCFIHTARWYASSPQQRHIPTRSHELRTKCDIRIFAFSVPLFYDVSAECDIFSFFFLYLSENDMYVSISLPKKDNIISIQCNAIWRWLAKMTEKKINNKKIREMSWWWRQKTINRNGTKAHDSVRCNAIKKNSSWSLFAFQRSVNLCVRIEDAMPCDCSIIE